MIDKNIQDMAVMLRLCAFGCKYAAMLDLLIERHSGIDPDEALKLTREISANDDEVSERAAGILDIFVNSLPEDMQAQSRELIGNEIQGRGKPH